MPTVASLNVNLTAGVAQFAKQMKTATDSLDRLGKTVSGLGTKLTAFGVGLSGSIGIAVKQFASAGDALDEMSTRTGIAVESLSALSYAASFSSISMEKIGTAVGKMQRTLVDTPKKIEQLGINLQTFSSLKPEQQFAELADAITKLPTPAQQTAAAMAVFGKSGAALLPFLAEGSSGINRLTAEAQRLGVVMDGKTAKAAANIDDAFTKITASVTGLRNKLAQALAPSVTSIADKISATIPIVSNWIKENTDLIQATSVLAAGLVSLGVALKATSLAIATFNILVSASTKSLLLFNAAGVAATGMLTALRFGVAAITTIMVALTSPITAIPVLLGALGTAVVSVIAYFVDWRGVLSSIGNFLSNTFSSALDFTIEKLLEIGRLLGLVTAPKAIQMPAVAGRAQFLAGAKGAVAPQAQEDQKDAVKLGFMEALKQNRDKRAEMLKGQPQGLPGVDQFIAFGKNLLKPLEGLGQIGQAVQGIAGNALGQILLQNGKNFFERQADKTSDARGPSLIEAGTREAFMIGRGNRSNKPEDETAKNTGKTYKEIVKLANQLSQGLKVDIQNIEAFAQ